MKTVNVNPIILLLLFWFLPNLGKSASTEFTEHSFLVAELNPVNSSSTRFWNFLQSNTYSGIELSLEQKGNQIHLSDSETTFNTILERILDAVSADSSKIIPVFIAYNGEIKKLDSIIANSQVSNYTFYLPQGEAWPTMEYLIQANRRILYFVDGDYTGTSKILHPLQKYVLQIPANGSLNSSDSYSGEKNITSELLMVNNFEQLTTQFPPTNLNRNLVPDYINFLLETWTRYGKRPNFIFTGENVFNFEFIIEQLRSFAWINGAVKVADKTMEKVYWKNPDIAVTGGNFSFPYRGGEELTLSPFAPGYQMTPEHIIVTGEMDIPETYTIIALPRQLHSKLTGSFNFENIILNKAQPSMVFRGENFSFSQDIERGTVLRLPEDASVNLGSPENFGFRNSSFTVTTFVKFNEILEAGDNAVLGNYESGYRRGLHLILRSGRPYFGLWANDFVSNVELEPNIWYHLAWRYILETGEQAIFLNGRYIGSSAGHPPFSGTGDIHLGSALSQGASLRGYIDDLYIWDRPLGNDEINRLALDEQVIIETENDSQSFLNRLWVKFLGVLAGVFLLLVMFIVIFRKARKKKPKFVVPVPEPDTKNQVRFFGKFKAVDKAGVDITEQFTPKIKELFLFVVLYTLKTGNGAKVAEIDKNLWPGLPFKKVANNRAVTLNKLRKVLTGFEGIEIVTKNSFLVAE
ncbi:MAG TPA: LamG-like jellyroll fold domain-containing protein, partial [Prolixibacteraceae bacterium]|nr:LamG-like jellyroll fold domain-containing protein [Prolixibacteraceae bacterium]